LSIADVVARPARDYADACLRFDALHALDGPLIAQESASRFFGHGRRTPLGVVLVHGLTNAPEQWALFAGQLFERGCTVVVPRLPGHGHRNRLTSSIEHVSARALLETASEATDIALGAAGRVVVAGLSIGGGIAAWIGLHRADVARSVPIVPLFGLRPLGALPNEFLAGALRTFPNVFLAWDPFDPKGVGREIPRYGYPRFSTRLLGRCLGIGLDVYGAAAQRAPAGSVAMLLNAKEPVCNNDLAREIARRFNRVRAASTEVVVLDDLPENHDIIDPTNPNARIELVYPPLQALIER